ncbi:MAG: leucine-rich repeat domain-containing protein [Bacteroidaceae bacterium]|nr:leucine-rich repeat domain-containing protein [Bacteroidaceae bacterium]
MKKYFNIKKLSLAILFLATAMPAFAQREERITSMPELEKREGNYIIKSTEDYEKFRQIVALGNPYANAVLEADIKVTKSIGDGDTPFHYRGTFDGQGHTVTLEDENNTENYNSTLSGLFKYTEAGCVIRNLHVSGHVFPQSETPTYAGSIVDDATGTTIENCISDAVLYGDHVRGGLVGIARGKCFLDNSAFIGRIPQGESLRSGLVGNNTQSISMKSCYVDVDFGYQLGTESEPDVFANRLDIEILNNYFTYHYKDKNGDINLMNVPFEGKVTDDEVKNGTLCYKLNRNGRKGVVWYQHGDHPYPFKGSDGQLVTSTDSGSTIEKGTSECSHEYGNDYVCHKCGAVQEGVSIEPLQARNSYNKENGTVSIDNIKYQVSNKGEATVLGLEWTSAAVHIPENINIDGTVYNVTSISENAFEGNIGLAYCYIPKSVKSIGRYAFLKCKLEYLHIADGPYSTNKADIKEHALKIDIKGLYDSNIDKIYVGRDLMWDKEPMESTHDNAYLSPFFYNHQLFEIHWGPNVSQVGNLLNDEEDQFHYFDNYSKIHKVVFMGNEHSLNNELLLTTQSIWTDFTNWTDFYINRNINGKYITPEVEDAGLLYGCKAVTYGPYVKSIPDNSYKRVGENYKPLKTVDLSHAFNLESIGQNAFYNCENIECGLDLSTTKVTTIGEFAFANSGFRSAVFNDETTTISERAFENCTSLEGLYIPASVESIGSKAFASCTKLSRVIFDDSEWGLELSDGQFDNCPKISNTYLGRSIIISGGATSSSFQPNSSNIWTIGPKVTFLQKALFPLDKYDSFIFLHSDDVLYFDGRFNGTTNTVTLDRKLRVTSSDSELGTLSLPFNLNKYNQIENINIDVHITKIPANMFAGCSKVRNLFIPENIKEIGDKAFKGCSALEVLCIMGKPNVGKYAFEGGTNMKYLYLVGDTIKLDDGAFHDCKIQEIIPAFTKDPGTGSSEHAFDPWNYAYTRLAVNNVTFNTQPWVNFTKKGTVTTTSTFSGQPDEELGTLYDRASLSHSFPQGRFDMVYLPFDMDSYYFGVDAEIYRVDEDNDKFSNTYTMGNDDKSFDAEKISLQKVNIDTQETLTKGHVYLIKTNEKEEKLIAYNNLFQANGITLAGGKYIQPKSSSSSSILAAGNVNEKLNSLNHFYVCEDGVIKFHNGGKYTPNLASTGFYLGDDNNRPIAYNLVAGNALLLSSKSDVVFHPYLEGFSTFYDADYHHIAPDWCDVYIITSVNDGNEVSLEKIEDRTITKGQAVLLKSHNNEKLPDVLTEYLTYATNGSSCSFAGNLLKGVDKEQTVGELDRDFIYVLGCNNDFKNAGFYKFTADKKMTKGKAYLDPEGLSPQQLAKACLLVCNDATTHITSRPADNADRTWGIYDLMGRRLRETGYKGIYLIDGKKVIRK